MFDALTMMTRRGRSQGCADVDHTSHSNCVTLQKSLFSIFLDWRVSRLSTSASYLETNHEIAENVTITSCRLFIRRQCSGLASLRSDYSSQHTRNMYLPTTTLVL